MRKLLFLYLLILLPFWVLSQSSLKFSGVVLDSMTRKPIADVQISDQEHYFQVMTDDKGNFNFETSSSGMISVVLKHVGYIDQSLSLRPEQSSTKLSWIMVPRVFHLGEFVVEGKMTPMIVATRISEIKIRQSSNRDIGDFLREVPNFSAIRKGGTGLDPVVRGLRFSQLNVQLDNGIRVEGGCPNRMDPTTAHVEIEDVENMEIVKGPYVLKYGPSFGGIINLNTYQPRFFEKTEVHGTAMSGFESNWNGSRQHLILDAGGKKLSMHLSGGYKKYDNYSDGDGNEVKSGFKKYSYTAGIGFQPCKDQRLILNYRESHGRDVLYPSLPMDEKSDDTWIGSLDYLVINISPFLQAIEVKMYSADVDHVMDNSLRSNYSTMQAIATVDARNTGGRVTTKWAIGDHWFNIGADYEGTWKDGTRKMQMKMNMGGQIMTMKVNTNLWYDASIHNTGVFAEYKRNIGKTSLELSARYDINTGNSEDTLKIIKEGVSYFEKSASTFNNLSFNCGATHSLNRNWSVSLAAGRGVRSPNMTERYIKFLTVGYDNYDYIGDPGLKPEVNYQGDLTLRFSDPDLGRCYVNGFMSYITGFITGNKLPSSVATPKTSGALGVKQFYNADYALLNGFELSYQSPKLAGIFQLDWMMAYTHALLSEAEKIILFNNKPVDQETVKKDPLNEIPPLESTLSLSASLFRSKLVPSISARLVAAQNEVSKAMYEPKSEGFTLVNLALQYQPSENFRISGGVNNLFDLAYYEHLNRKIVGTTEKLFEPGRVFHITFIGSF